MVDYKDVILKLEKEIEELQQISKELEKKKTDLIVQLIFMGINPNE